MSSLIVYELVCETHSDHFDTVAGLNVSHIHKRCAVTVHAFIFTSVKDIVLSLVEVGKVKPPVSLYRNILSRYATSRNAYWIYGDVMESFGNIRGIRLKTSERK
ncbi:hypothetical protein J6590_048425 [Homalodisca vitripennis]|nr:hypothetical protein J6590_048425 [Homalodisca vitripennis]